MAASNLASDDDILGHHLPYEIWMLQETHQRLKGAVSDQVVTNALIESFCIHARQLLDFFENKQGRCAKDFTGGTYNATCLSYLRTQRTKLNTQIAHLTACRTKDPKEKIGGTDRDKLLKAILREARNFQSNLVGTFAETFKLPVPNTLNVADLSVGATNAITSTTTSLEVWGHNTT